MFQWSLNKLLPPLLAAELVVSVLGLEPDRRVGGTLRACVLTAICERGWAGTHKALHAVCLFVMKTAFTPAHPQPHVGRHVQDVQLLGMFFISEPAKHTVGSTNSCSEALCAGVHHVCGSTPCR